MNCKFDDGKTCKALVIKTCAGCRFCLTEEQAAQKKIIHDNRLTSLPAMQQRAIADTYYVGKALWQM